MLFTILGIAICLAVLLQLGLFAIGTWSQMSFNRQQYAASKHLLQKQIQNSVAVAASQQVNRSPMQIPGDWKGFREFFVAQVTPETSDCKSVYLKPVDGKPITSFQPGQHLTIRLPIPGETKPLVRCYTISDGPGKDYYRITVKAIAGPPGTELPPGKVSCFLNANLIVGDRLDIKSPSGNFFLDRSNAPVVMLAGGIGVTPFISMIDSLVEQQSSRTVLLAYGVRNSQEQPFKQYINDVCQSHANIHVVNCFSSPTADDVRGTDYHVDGYVSVDMLKKILPNNEYLFYLCGPPPFMNSLFDGLKEWGVPESRIRFEAFGPATIKRKRAAETTDSSAIASDVNFSASGKKINWDSDCDSLLDLAEANQINIEFGCRAGSCGSCETDLLSGKVRYIEGATPTCSPDKCLVCIAQPQGSVELGA